jgi:anti-sigma B factor antagonist
MNVSTSTVDGIIVMRVNEPRLTYPILSDFASAVSNRIGAGDRRIVIDLSPVGYVDSATIGCFMDLYRQATAAGGSLKLSSVQKRVETMLTMTGAHNFLEVHATQAAALASFGG